EHHLVAIARNARGHREEAGERRVERAVAIERTGRERLRLGIDQVNDPVAHAVAPGVDRRGKKESAWVLRPVGGPRQSLQARGRLRSGHRREPSAQAAPPAPPPPPPPPPPP